MAEIGPPQRAVILDRVITETTQFEDLLDRVEFNAPDFKREFFGTTEAGKVLSYVTKPDSNGITDDIRIDAARVIFRVVLEAEKVWLGKVPDREWPFVLNLDTKVDRWATDHLLTRLSKLPDVGSGDCPFMPVRISAEMNAWGDVVIDDGDDLHERDRVRFAQLKAGQAYAVRFNVAPYGSASSPAD